MNWPKFAAYAIPTLLLAFVLTAFSMQNLSRTTELSLNLGLGGVQLQAPIPVPALMGICIFAGFILGLLAPPVWRWVRNTSTATDSYGDASTSR